MAGRIWQRTDQSVSSTEGDTLRKTPVYLAFLVLVIGGLFFSVNGSATISKYDGHELDQDHSKDHPVKISWNNLIDNCTKLITINIDDYITKPNGSLLKMKNYEVAGVKISVPNGIDTNVVWDYVKVIPEATISLIIGKLLELFNIGTSLIVLVAVTATEIINTIIGVTYERFGIEWEYDRYISEETGIVYRTIKVYTPEGEEASISQFIQYIFGMAISGILCVIAIRVGIIVYDEILKIAAAVK